jgi:hypothetical protein
MFFSGLRRTNVAFGRKVRKDPNIDWLLVRVIWLLFQFLLSEWLIVVMQPLNGLIIDSTSGHESDILPRFIFPEICAHFQNDCDAQPVLNISEESKTQKGVWRHRS